MTNEERIKADAERIYRGKPDSRFPSNFKYIDGYIAGATAEHDRAQVLVDALEEIANSPVPANEREMQSWIETARTLASSTLEQWKGKEVEGETGKCTCSAQFYAAHGRCHSCPIN